MSAWRGMNAATGRALTDLDHIRQSIRKILTTPIGARVERRPFGSIIPDLVDAPINPVTRLQVMAATATAVITWEPRLRPARISLEFGAEPSELVVDLTGTLTDGVRAGETVNLSIPLT